MILYLILLKIHSKSDKTIIYPLHMWEHGRYNGIKRGEAHLAPIHLLDEKTGAYNISYIKRYLPNIDMALIKGVKRYKVDRPKRQPQEYNKFEDISGKIYLVK